MAVLTVTNLLDSGSGSLRDAIAQSNTLAGDDIIEFSPDLSGTLSLTTGELRITDSVSIHAPGADQFTIDAQQQSRIFHIDDTENLLLEVDLEGLTLTGGRVENAQTTGGAILNTGRLLSISNSVITGNSVVGTFEARGGAIANISTFVKSESPIGPGSSNVLATPAHLVIRNTVILNNSVVLDNPFGIATGGGIASFNQMVGNFTPEDSENSSVFELNQGSVTLLDSSIANNSISSNGPESLGGGVASESGLLDVQNSTVLSNTVIGTDSGTDALGGGLYIGLGQLNLNNSAIANNTLEGAGVFASGGGIGGFSSELRISSSTIVSNAATALSGSGGGIMGFDSDLFLTDSIVASNTTTAGGADVTLIRINNEFLTLNERFNVLGTPIELAGPTTNDGSSEPSIEPDSDVSNSHALNLNEVSEGEILAQTPLYPLLPQESTVLNTPENQVLQGTAEADHLIGGDADDQLYGNGGPDILVGGGGNDQLYGAANSNEIFDGGLGNDELWMNGGHDQIILRRGDGTDSINGFQAGQTQFLLAEGLTFADLSFRQGDGFSEVIAGDSAIAQVNWVSVAELNTATNFALV